MQGEAAHCDVRQRAHVRDQAGGGGRVAGIARMGRGARRESTSRSIDYPAPAPLPSLWARPDAACVFMCGYPLVAGAAAAARPRRAGAQSTRVMAASLSTGPTSSCAVESKITRLEETFGHRFAFTTEDSQSGYQAPRLLLARHAHGASLFAATVGPLVTPRRVVEAVLAGDADAGPARQLRARSAAPARTRARQPFAGHRRDAADTDSAARCGDWRCRRRRGTHCRRLDGGRRQRCIGGDPCDAPARRFRTRIGRRLPRIASGCAAGGRDSATRACLEDRPEKHRN